MSVADEKMIENMRAESKQRRHTAIEKKIPWLDKLQLRHHVDNHKFSKTWAFRNYDHAEAVTNSLEMGHIFFQGRNRALKALDGEGCNGGKMELEHRHIDQF